jgi:uncharacterized protein (DUF1800 family)
MTEAMQYIIQNRFGYGFENINIQNNKANLLDYQNWNNKNAIYGQSTRQIMARIYEINQTPNADKEEIRKARNQFGRQILNQAQVARLNYALNTNNQFMERLVHFWANHFAISSEKQASRPITGAYEFEAIRPNINGRFVDLLMAAITHSAMLIYLDQAQSIDENSKIGERRNNNQNDKKIGINENLAREILELHTLGVNGNYSQNDVTQFAFALAGFTIISPQKKQNRNAPFNAQIGDFYFEPLMHKNQIIEFMGKRYNQSNMAQALAIIKFIANHPNTAQHIATKLARHFFDDNPPAFAIERLKNRFLQSDGDLAQVYDELLNIPQIWNLETKKFKSPWEWIIGVLGNLGVKNVDNYQIAQIMRNLGQEVWQPKSPKGFDDIESAWAAPDALYRRLEVANILSKRINAPNTALNIAQSALGPFLSEHTKTAITRAESEQQALCLLFLCPEFLRR